MHTYQLPRYNTYTYNSTNSQHKNVNTIFFLLAVSVINFLTYIHIYAPTSNPLMPGSNKKVAEGLSICDLFVTTRH